MPDHPDDIINHHKFRVHEVKLVSYATTGSGARLNKRWKVTLTNEVDDEYIFTTTNPPDLGSTFFSSSQDKATGEPMTPDNPHQLTERLNKALRPFGVRLTPQATNRDFLVEGEQYLTSRGVKVTLIQRIALDANANIYGLIRHGDKGRPEVAELNSLYPLTFPNLAPLIGEINRAASPILLPETDQAASVIPLSQPSNGLETT